MLDRRENLVRHGRLVAARLALLLALLAIAGCGSSPQAEPSTDAARWPARLSEFGLFDGALADLNPAEGVVPYDLNTPLFSDYAVKRRHVKLPEGQAAEYHDVDAFEFPVGTLIAKTFAYPLDERSPENGARIVETRILLRDDDGWVGLPYVWNDEQTEALLDVAGSTTDVAWIDAQGTERTVNYIIPNSNQCKGCHKIGDEMQPIGPKARHLNRDFAYAGGVENQLAHWTRIGALVDAPEPHEAPRLAVWDDPSTGTLDERARAWLEVNCAHCHNPAGPARNSGLDLLAAQTNPTSFGIMKTPVAAGRGTGGRSFDIAPGRPDDSILQFRIESTDAGVMMPELGKRLVHAEGAALVREWIASLDDQSHPRPNADHAADAAEEPRDGGG